jgi:hypothetical protein
MGKLLESLSQVKQEDGEVPEHEKQEESHGRH